jgi:hypothetical protein
MERRKRRDRHAMNRPARRALISERQRPGPARRVRDCRSVFLGSMVVILGLVRQSQLRFQSRDRQRLAFVHFLNVAIPIDPPDPSVKIPSSYSGNSCPNSREFVKLAVY